MATRIELPKDIVEAAFEKHIQSLRRAQTSATNKLIKNALADEERQIKAAIATVAEIK